MDIPKSPHSFSALLAALAAAAAMAPNQAAATIFETNDTQRANLAAVAAWQAPERALRIDAAAGEVVVLAEFCSIDAAATVEFPIVGELSDRDYESIFRTFARPGAIAAAIESIGLPRGKNASPASFDFWPRGERVAIDVAPFADTNATWVPIQRYIVDLATRAPLAFDSFVYCGSQNDPQPDFPAARVADTYAPNSVLSTYNESQTLLDLPARFSQGEVYGRFVLAPDHGLTPFGLYRIRFRPAPRADGLPRVRDLAISAVHGKDGIEYEISENGGPASRIGQEALVAAIRKMTADGFDPFASLSFDGSLTVAEVAAQARFFSTIDGEGGIRVKGPGDDTIHYRGFLPDDAWRVRKDRPSQPWEMRLAEDASGAVRATLIKTIEDWTSSESLDPILSTREFDAATPEAARAIVEKEGDGLPVLLVFAPAEMPLSRAMPFVIALKPSHPTVYIFATDCPSEN